MPLSPYDTNQNANNALLGGASANAGMGFSRPGLPTSTGGGSLPNAAAQAMQDTQARQASMEAQLNRAQPPMMQQAPMVAINSQTGEVDTGLGTFNIDDYHQGKNALQNNWLSSSPKYLRPGFRPISADALANYIQNPTSSTMDRVKDVGIDIARGVVNAGQTAAGLASLATGGLAGKGLAAVGYDPNATHGMLSEGYSRGRQAAEDQVANAQGFSDTFGAMLQNPSTILGGAIQSAPDMIGAYGIARKAALGIFNRAYAAALEASGGNAEYAGTMAANALKANQGRLLAIGHGTEGIQAAGQNAGQVMNDDPNNVAGQYMQIPGGALTGLIGYGAGRVANAVGLEDPLAGLAKRGLSGPVGGKAASLGRTAGRIIGGGVVEGGLEEGPQSAQEQVWQNLGQNKPWDEGVGKAAGQGAVIGAAMGMGMSALHGRAHVDARDNMNPQELLKSGTQMQLAGMNPTQPAAPLHVGADQNQMYGPPTPPGGIPNSGQMDMFPQGDLFGPAGPASMQPQQGAMAFRGVPNPGQMQLPMQGTMFGQTPTLPMAAPPVPMLEQTHPGQGNLFDQHGYPHENTTGNFLQPTDERNVPAPTPLTPNIQQSSPGQGELFDQHGYPYTRPQDDWLHSDGSQQTQTRPARPHVPIEQMHPGVFQINEPPTEPPAPPAGGGRSNAAQHHVPGPATQAETKNRAHGGAIVNPPGEPIARGMGPQESDAITGQMTNPPGELIDGYPEGIKTGRQRSLWDAARSAGVAGEEMINAIGSGKYAYAEKLIPKLVKEKADAEKQPTETPAPKPAPKKAEPVAKETPKPAPPVAKKAEPAPAPEKKAPPKAAAAKAVSKAKEKPAPKPKVEEPVAKEEPKVTVLPYVEPKKSKQPAGVSATARVKSVFGDYNVTEVQLTTGKKINILKLGDAEGKTPGWYVDGKAGKFKEGYGKYLGKTQAEAVKVLTEEENARQKADVSHTSDDVRLNKDITNNPDVESRKKAVLEKLDDIATDSSTEAAKMRKQANETSDPKEKASLMRKAAMHSAVMKEAEALAEEVRTQHDNHAALLDAEDYANDEDNRDGVSINGMTMAEHYNSMTRLTSVFKDGLTAGRWLSEHMSNKSLRIVAQRILPFLGNIKIHAYDGTGTAVPKSIENFFKRNPDTVAAAAHNYGNGTSDIYLHTKRGKGFTEETLLHELVHGATKERLLDPEISAKFEELGKLISAALNNLGVEHPQIAVYAKEVLDPNELVAYANTEPALRELLGLMDGSGKWAKGGRQIGKRVRAELPHYSMWKRFVDTVTSALGLPKFFSGKIDQVIDFNRAVDNYNRLASSQTMQARIDALTKELLGSENKIARWRLDRMVIDISARTEAGTAASEYSEAAKEALKKSTEDAGQYVGEAKLWLMSLSQLDDIYGNDLKDDNTGKSYIRTIVDGLRNMGNTKEQLRRSADSIRKQYDLLTPQEQARVGTMLPLVSGFGYKSTGTGSSLTLERGKSGFTDAFDGVKKDFDAMSVEEKKIYAAVRDEIKKLNDLLVKELYEKAARHGGDASSMLDKIMANSNRQEGDYFPFMRFGDHVVVFKSPEFRQAERDGDDKAVNKMKPNPKHYDVRFFEDKGSAQVDLTAQQAEKGMENVGYKLSPDYIRNVDSVSAKFMNNVDKMFDTHNPRDAELKKAFTALYIRSMPDYSNANRSLTRARVAGYSKDSRRAFAAYADRMASSVGKIRHMDTIEDALEGAKIKAAELTDETARTTGVADPKFTQVVNILRRHEEALVSPKYKSGAWQTFATNTAYVWHLATASFGLSNLAQGPLISGPVMAARLRISNFRAQSAMTSALADAFQMQKGWFNEAQGTLWSRIAEFGPKFMNEMEGGKETGYVIPDLSKELKSGLIKNEGEAELIKYLYQKSQIDLTQAHDLSAVAEGRDTRNQKIMRTLSMFAHQTEVMNRISTGLAAYRLSMEHNGIHESKAAKEDAARKFAEKIIQDTHGDYSTENAPLAFKPGANPLARVMMQFRKYQQMMVYLYGRNIKQSLPFWNDADPETRSLARRTLVNLLMTQGMAAGVMGMPFFGSVAGLIGLIAAALNGKDDPWDEERVKAEFRGWLSDHFGKEAGEVMAHGVLHAPLIRSVAPASISQRLGQEDIGQLVNMKVTPGNNSRDSFFEYLGKAIAGPAGGVAADWATAYDMFHQGRFDRGFEYASPKFIRDILKTVRYSNEGLTDSKGVTVLNSERFNFVDKFWQAVGFTPTDVAETQEARGAEASYVADLGERKKNLINQFVRARMSGDTTEAAHIRDVLGEKFNETNPQDRILGKDWNSAYIGAVRGQSQLTPEGIPDNPLHSERAQVGRFANVR